MLCFFPETHALQVRPPLSTMVNHSSGSIYDNVDSLDRCILHRDPLCSYHSVIWKCPWPSSLPVGIANPFLFRLFKSWEFCFTEEQGANLFQFYSRFLLSCLNRNRSSWIWVSWEGLGLWHCCGLGWDILYSWISISGPNCMSLVIVGADYFWDD